jgi:hypothetical protein
VDTKNCGPTQRCLGIDTEYNNSIQITFRKVISFMIDQSVGVRKSRRIFGLSKGKGKINHSIAEEALFPDEKKLTFAARPHVEAFRWLRRQYLGTSSCSKWQKASRELLCNSSKLFPASQN